MKENDVVLIIMRKRILLFVLLLSVFMIGGVSASSDINDTVSSKLTDNAQKQISTKQLKEVNKDDDGDVVKSKNVDKDGVDKLGGNVEGALCDVTDFNSLNSALNNDEETSVIVNLKSNIKLKNSLRPHYKIKKLTIWGNGKTINGDNKYQFLVCYNNVIIENLKIINCNSKGSSESDGGAIYVSSGSLTIKDSTLTNNIAKGSGGAIYGYQDSKINIYNTIFNKNKASWSGGAISGAEFNIKNSRFNNNIVTWSGGAIDGNYKNGKYTIKDSYFTNNQANSGGAIYSKSHNINIINNLFKSNSASNGGAIYNSGENNTIKNNIFESNKAEYGGAIYNHGGITEYLWPNKISVYEGSINLNINKNTFSYNTANTGSAVYNIAKTMKIQNNIFKKNKAKSNGKVIESGDELIFNNNINYDYSKYSSTIYTSMDAKITKNLFDDGVNYTKITINKIPNTKYNENIIITGKLTDSFGKILANKKLKLNINGKTYNIKTNTKGIYTKTIKNNQIGKNKIQIKFIGDKKYQASTNKTTFQTTKQKIKITTNKIKTTPYGSKIIIKGKITDATKKPLPHTIIVNINGKTYNVQANTKGIFTKTIKTDKIGTNTITIKHPGNQNYKPLTIKKTFKVIKKIT